MPLMAHIHANQVTLEPAPKATLMTPVTTSPSASICLGDTRSPEAAICISYAALISASPRAAATVVYAARTQDAAKKLRARVGEREDGQHDAHLGEIQTSLHAHHRRHEGEAQPRDVVRGVALPANQAFEPAL
eukprot:scaffold3815_cov355-Prasinococcus_capsulatus_cf.AAC.6